MAHTGIFSYLNWNIYVNKKKKKKEEALQRLIEVSWNIIENLKNYTKA